MGRTVPFGQRCELCGRQKLPNGSVCAKHKRLRDRSFAVPGRDVAHNPPERPLSQAEETASEQDAVLEELSRCASCGAPWGGHELTCPAVAFMELGEEYDPGNYAETL